MSSVTTVSNYEEKVRKQWVITFWITACLPVILGFFAMVMAWGGSESYSMMAGFALGFLLFSLCNWLIYRSAYKKRGTKWLLAIIGLMGFNIVTTVSAFGFAFFTSSNVATIENLVISALETLFYAWVFWVNYSLYVVNNKRLEKLSS